MWGRARSSLSNVIHICNEPIHADGFCTPQLLLPRLVELRNNFLSFLLAKLRLISKRSSHSVLSFPFYCIICYLINAVHKNVLKSENTYKLSANPTLSLSMASSLAGLKTRSWRLVMDPARLDRADSEGEGLIPVMALVTVERSPL